MTRRAAKALAADADEIMSLTELDALPIIALNPQRGRTTASTHTREAKHGIIDGFLRGLVATRIERAADRGRRLVHPARHGEAFSPATRSLVRQSPAHVLGRRGRHAGARWRFVALDRVVYTSRRFRPIRRDGFRVFHRACAPGVCCLFSTAASLRWCTASCSCICPSRAAEHGASTRIGNAR